MKRVIKAIEKHLAFRFPEKEVSLIRHDGYQYNTVFFEDGSEVKVEIEYEALDAKIVYVKVQGEEKTAYRP